MSDIGSSAYSESDASNNQPPPAGWPSGMFPNQVEGAAQANMGATKRWYTKANPVYTTSGTNTAYTITSVGAAESAYHTGQLYLFIINATCGANPTLNWDTLGAVNLRKFTGGAWTNLAAGDLQANQIVAARYNGTQFDVLLASFNVTDFPILGGNNTWSGTQTLKATLTMSGAPINEAVRVDLASAATVAISAAASNYLNITGATTITAFDTAASGVERELLFAGALTLTHNATSLINLGGANITTVAGDVATFRSEGSGNWRMTKYQKADGTALVLAQTAQGHATVSGGVVTNAKVSGLSVARLGTGSYEVTLSPAMPDTNYIVSFTAAGNTNLYCTEDGTFTRTTTKFRLNIGGDNIGSQDPTAINLKVFA